MQVESINFNSIKAPQAVRKEHIADANDIRSILYLGIRTELPAAESKHKVDIII